jgi:signal transduction histidine kinase
MDGSLDDLRREVEELRASRARVVAAADAERRRIERDLHDGPQQHFVALAVKLQLARQLADSDPVALGLLLEELGRDVREGLEGVRELAHAIYPSLLVDRGLVEALAAAASATEIDARLEAVQLDRHPPEIEATVYFCCLEALQNAAKHAGRGARTTVRAWREHDALRFEIADDGAGFDPNATPPGGGLAGMRDRVGAVAGRLTIRSAPGRGTIVSGTIPMT